MRIQMLRVQPERLIAATTTNLIGLLFNFISNISMAFVDDQISTTL